MINSIAGITRHEGLQELEKYTRSSGLLFKIDSLGELLGHLSNSDVKARFSIHIFKSTCVAMVERLSIGDLGLLSHFATSVLVRHCDNLCEQVHPRQLVCEMDRLGFQLFFPHGTNDSARFMTKRHSLIGSLEFLASEPARLARYPVLARDFLSDSCRGISSTVKLVFVLDLVQDFEVLRPLLLRAALPDHNLRVEVVITSKTMDSYNWPNVSNFLVAMGLQWSRVESPLAIVDALGKSRSLLVTSSESTAPAHSMCYRACMMAPSRTTRITMQHGYENIGLRHHLAHDQSLRAGVRFASDVILTWSHPDELPNLHPMERNKCIAVGVIKNFAEVSAVSREVYGLGKTNGLNISDPQSKSVLVAENLHSVRFVSPVRYARFLGFVKELNTNPLVKLTIRSHPAIRKLQSNKELNKGFAFLNGDLTVASFRQFERIISPPSTIVLDAVLAGTPVSVWSDDVEIGDTQNYTGLSTITDAEQLLTNEGALRLGNAHQDFLWAVKNTSALNGVPFAWNTILRLA